MKVSTAGGVAALTGIVGLPLHAGITLITALGSSLASTGEDPVSDRANMLWTVALYGTFAAAIALVALLAWWTKPLAIAYAVVWIALIGTYWAAQIIEVGLAMTPLLLFEAALPLCSVAFALYGVWEYRSNGA